MEMLQATPPPRVGAALGHGWRTMKSQFGILLAAVIVYLLIVGAVSGPLTLAQVFGPSHLAYQITIQVIGNVLPALIGIPFAAGMALMFLQAARGERVEFATLFAGFQRFRDVVLASLAVAGLVIAGLILFIIPGIYVGLRLAMVNYLVMDEGMAPKQALRTSWDSMKGHTLRYFGLGLVSAVLVIVGMLLLVVGMFPAMVWTCGAAAAFYRGVRESGQSTMPAPNQPVS